MKTVKNVRPANSIQQKSVRMRVYGQTVCILTLFFIIVSYTKSDRHFPAHRQQNGESFEIPYADKIR